ncbi:type II secretion system protein GspM [Verminephrobacter aporrectodeae]|nr:type II secretion system protein GspM [Verminephrobacter aporrectodeae]
MQRLQELWKALAPREQGLVLAAAGLLALALLWWLALAPALTTLRAAPARHATLDAQLQRMHSLQAEAQELQAAPQPPPGDAVGALRTALVQRLGNTARLDVVGEHVTVTLQGAHAEPLAQWLAQARSNAHTTPLEARLTRSAAAPEGAAADPANRSAPRWDGTLLLALPATAAR